MKRRVIMCVINVMRISRWRRALAEGARSGVEWSLVTQESGLTGYIGLSTLTTLKDSFKLTRLLQYFLSPGGGGLGQGRRAVSK